MAAPDKARRILADALTAKGRQSLAARAVDRLSSQVPPEMIRHHLLPRDVVSHAKCPPGVALAHGRPLSVGWVMTPPGPGSGGHTTAFRMVKAIEDAGHACELLLYDPFGGAVDARVAVIRSHWPDVTAEVRSLDDGFGGLDAVVATGWQTAHALATRSAGLPMHRFYFIQDYEPFFYPRGFEYAVAEQTYTFGFHNIALGEMVQRHIASLGATSSVVPFGCDTETYRVTPKEPDRSGIVFYARAQTSRRGFLLATMGLAELHRRRPEVPIKVYGPARRTELPFPVEWKGLLTPTQLNELYNSSICGLGLSFTNISLVVGELLAAGCVPVVNDSPDNRLMAPGAGVAWTDATPTALADTLVRLVDDPPAVTEALSQTMATTWADTGSRLVEVIERVSTGCSPGDGIE